MLKIAALTAASAVALLAAPAFAQATNVALGKTVTGTAYYDSGTEVFPFSNITDGRFNDTGSPANWSFWLTPNGQTGTAVIDLGSLYNLSSIAVQNTLNRVYQDREAATVNFYGSTAAPVLGTTSSYGSLLNSTTFVNTEGTGVITEASFNFAPTLARYVTVDLTSFYGASGGLNEVQVFGTQATPGAVPEPASWAMMLVGFGMVGFGLRYRRKNQTARLNVV